MIMPFVLCLYLVAVVIDPIFGAVQSGSIRYLRKALLYLLILIILVLAWKNEFIKLSEKEHTKLVFTPRVFIFFAYACAAWVSARFTLQNRPVFLGTSVALALAVYWIGSRLFGFYPIKTRQAMRTWRISLLTLCGIAGFFLLPSLFGFGNEDERNGAKTMQGAQQGIDIEQIQAQQRDIPDLVVTQDDEQNNQVNNVLSGELTYGKLLTVLDEQGKLRETQENPEFESVSTSNPLYQSFQRAWGMRLIGLNTAPTRKVRCANLMVILGIVNDREVQQNTDVLNAYWEASTNYTARGGCADPDLIVTDWQY